MTIKNYHLTPNGYKPCHSTVKNCKYGNVISMSEAEYSKLLRKTQNQNSNEDSNNISVIPKAFSKAKKSEKERKLEEIQGQLDKEKELLNLFNDDDQSYSYGEVVNTGYPVMFKESSTENPMIDEILYEWKNYENDSNNSDDGSKEILKYIKDSSIREKIASKYSFSIPTQYALEEISKRVGNDTIIDPMTGTGYWASLLKNKGVNVRASDIHLIDNGENHYHSEGKSFCEIHREDAVEVINSQKPKHLLLSWPPYGSDIGYRCVEKFKGEYLFYLGEHYDGCCGTEEMFDKIQEKFELEEVVEIPQWSRIHDALYIYKRK